MSPFAKKATNKEGGDYELPPGGTHPARLIGLINLGTHSFVYNGKASESEKLYFIWELTAEKNKDGDSFIVAADYTFSLNVKANMRKMIEGWIGRALADQEIFDPFTLMGEPCIISLSEGQTGSGKKFMEVMSVGRPMRGLTVPDATYTPFFFTVQDGMDPKTDPPIPAWVPYLYGRKVVDEIKSSKEWGALLPF